MLGTVKDLPGPPPIAFEADVKLIDILNQVYDFSQDLVDSAPKVILLYGDTVQVNWALADESMGSTIRIKFEASPHAPSVIVPHPFEPY